MTDPIQAFRDAIAAAGLMTDDPIIDDGALHRFNVHGDKRNAKNGWYVLHGDGMPAGAFGSWKHDVNGTWSAKAEHEFTPDERRAHAKRMEEAKRQREAEQQRVREDARKRAAEIWAQSTPANDDHPYLVRKQVKAHGLRESQGKLVLPMYSSDGILQSLQFIDAEGNKRFLTGGQKRGCYYGIGRRPVDRLVVTEGFATGASITQATGTPVAIAFDAGNLEPVCEALRLKLPTSIAIEIWADNDVATPGNPGITKATKAAAKIGAQVVAPEAGDFNDMAISQGLDAVAAMVPTNDNDMPLVDYFSPLQFCDSKGKPMAIIENLAEITHRLGVTVRYNVIKKEDEILIPGRSFTVDNAANASLAWLRSECVRFRYPTDALGDYVTYLADQNLFNPVINWVTSKPWDGVSRLADLYGTIDAEDNELKAILMRRWMVSAIAAAFNPEGVSAHGVLVLQGPQYLGKTKWFKTLVPAHLDVVQDGHLLRVDDKDNIRQACSNWLVELGELDASFRKSDIAALKAFITKKKDVMRRAYAKKDSHFARRTVFFGSVNPKQFLHDSTGNRRYWTVECKWIDHSHNIDMQQLWAEVLFLYNNRALMNEIALIKGSVSGSRS